ncbi:MAG TPA: hypothetical protein VGE35_00850 [Candidatus Paceibacterota bacterium]
MKKLNIARKISILATGLVFGLTVSAQTQSKDANTATKPTAATAAVQKAAPDIVFAGLQHKIPGNKTGDVLFYSHDKFGDEAKAIEHANKVLKVPCRAATQDEIAALNQAHGKDNLYRAATTLGVGHGTENGYKLGRNAVTVILTKPSKVARNE